MELAILIKPDKDPPDPVLLDDPSKLKVVVARAGQDPPRARRHPRPPTVGRQGPSAHANVPAWKLSAKLAGDGKAQPEMNFSEAAGRHGSVCSFRRATNGRRATS